MAKYKYTPKTKEELKALVNNLDIYLGDIDTQYITDMSHLFYNSKRENSNFSGIELWNTSNVINMDYMFANTLSFNKDISSWDVSSVESMKSMFWGAESFNQPLELWNVSKVRNMNAMFCDTLSFNQPLNKWNVSNVQDMAFLFSKTAVFNQPIGDWNTSSVTTMKCMFSFAKAFNQDISNWNVSNVKNMYGMFWDAISFNQDIGNWDVSNVTDMSWMFCYAVKFNQSLCLWNTRKVKNMSYMFANAYSFNQDIGNWNLSSVECMTDMLKNAKKFQFEQPVKYSFYNLDKNRSNTMQNGKIIKITDRVITVELKYNFYGSVERGEFFRKTSGYLCLYNFETKQISSIPAKLNKTVKDNVDSNTSVCIDISINEISDMEMNLLSNPAVFGFCLTKNTDTVILSELEDILTAQFQTDYLNKTEQKLDGRFLFILYTTIVAFVFFVICTSSFIIALTYTLFFLIFIAFVLTVILEFKEDDVNDEIAAIVNDWKKYKQVPFLKRRYVDKKMKQLLQRIRQVIKQQKEKQNDSADTKIKKQKYNASSDEKVIISLNQLSNLFLISDNDLRNVCSETYKLCQKVNSIEELANKKYLKEYIEKRLDRIEQVLNIWKSANRVSSVSSSEMFNIKQKSIETINLINNKLKEKIQNEIFLININLTSELEALQITENLR